MDICIFMKSCKESLLRLFGDNLLFLGLQGSYARGEAKETSDIDLVAILQKCGKEELLKYRTYIDSLPEKDIICGFIACLDVLRSWDGADRAQLVLDTNLSIKILQSYVLQSPKMISEELYCRGHVQYIMHPHTT